MATILRPGDPWTAIAPPGWEAVEQVCRSVYEDLDLVVTRTIDAFSMAIDEFQGPAMPFSPDDLLWSGRRNISGFLMGLAERRPPNDQELRFREMVGERSAARGFPLKPLIASYHIAYRELWSMLVERAVTFGGDAPRLLLNAGAQVWERMHATITAVAEGYERELSRRETLEMMSASDLLDAISRNAASPDAISRAVELGFAPDGPFVALSVTGPIVAIQSARAIAIALGPHPAAAAPDGSAAIVLAQVADPETLEGVLATAAAKTTVGIGSIVFGLEGAERSIREARLARELAEARGGPIRFEERWLQALVHANRESLESLFEAGIETAKTKPHLVDAVRAYAETDASIAEGARRLKLSQNSFRYRLDRWQTLTGWDPRTHDGMTRSIAALGLAGV